MLELIIFILVAVSMTNIVVYEYIFEWLHKIFDKVPVIGDLINCPTCLGFWVGCFLFTLFPIQYGFAIFTIFISGCVSSICNKIFGLLR